MDKIREQIAKLREGNFTDWSDDQIADTLEKLYAVYEAARPVASNCIYCAGNLVDCNCRLMSAIAAVQTTHEESADG